MFDVVHLIVLIPALPLAACLFTAACGKWALRENSHWPAVISLPLAFVLSCALLWNVRHESAGQPSATPSVASGHAGSPSSHAALAEHTVTLWTWVDVPAAGVSGASVSRPSSVVSPAAARDFRVDITLRADTLTAIMLCMVTFVSALVAVYSIGYMHGDPGYWRFFTYILLFVFSMTMLVSVSNFALLYVFWEAVGVCSYLLIGFWFQKPEASAAGLKAFLVNRIGDFGFALAVFLIWTTYGTLDFHDSPATAGVLGAKRLANPQLYVEGFVALAICLGLLAGACGKSAQFPLHVWLPDAMEGPTPVSALIHAATMVTAGVYLVARCTPLFAASPEAQVAVACIGAFTALLAALIALTQMDLKRVLAYSTVSQLGFMFLSLGTGTLAGVSAGMFHLFTHAFFKALLFLGAGSVMHAMGNVIDMRRFGGLRRVLPWTHATFWFGCLALAGVVPFSGFWSKDQIVAAVHDRYLDSSVPYGAVYMGLYYVALFTAFLTAFYTFRALFLTFYGQESIPPEAHGHAHESPPSMVVPLVVLAAGSLLVGGLLERAHLFNHVLQLTPTISYGPLPAGASEFHLDIAAISTILALAGLGLAAFLYLGDRQEVAALTRFAKSAYGLQAYYLSYGKFFFDQLYGAIVVWPLTQLAHFAYWLDRRLIDGLVDLAGQVPVVFGGLVRVLQTGLVQFYAVAMVLGLLVLAGALLVW